MPWVRNVWPSEVTELYFMVKLLICFSEAVRWPCVLLTHILLFPVFVSAA
jgi:hypothetical protein